MSNNRRHSGAERSRGSPRKSRMPRPSRPPKPRILTRMPARVPSRASMPMPSRMRRQRPTKNPWPRPISLPPSRPNPRLPSIQPSPRPRPARPRPRTRRTPPHPIAELFSWPARPAFLVSSAPARHSRLPSGAALLNTAENQYSPKRGVPGKRENKPEGNEHGAHLAQAISSRRARRYRSDPIRISRRVAGRELCEVSRPQGLHLHGQVDQLSRPRRDVAGAGGLSAEQRPAKGRPRRADDAERPAISDIDRRRAARGLRGRQRQSALHPARA